MGSSFKYKIPTGEAPAPAPTQTPATDPTQEKLDEAVIKKRMEDLLATKQSEGTTQQDITMEALAGDLDRKRKRDTAKDKEKEKPKKKFKF